jgi:hypothetical protein
MDENKLASLISLLDDPDDSVFHLIQNEILMEGVPIIERLEHIWETSLDDLVQRRIELLVQSIQLNDTKQKIRTWACNETLDLFEGAFLISRYQYPGIKLKNIQSQIEKIRKEVWLEYRNSFNSLEKITILNHVFFSRFKFKIDRSNTVSPQNCYINRVLDTRKGYPISIAILYMLVGRSLQLPLQYFDLEDNPLIGYADEKAALLSNGKNNNKPSTIFYINTTNKGAIIGPKEVEYFQQPDDVLGEKKQLVPCTDRCIIKCLVEKLKDDYKKTGSMEKVDYLREIAEIL